MKKRFVVFIVALVILFVLALSHLLGRKPEAIQQETTKAAVEKIDSTESVPEVSTLSKEDEIAGIQEYMKTVSAGTQVVIERQDLLPYYFVSEEIPEDVFARIDGKSYVSNNNVTLSDLRYLKVLHYDFQHQPTVGELIVCADLVEDYLSIFQELFEAEYEIEKMFLIDDYWVGNADDTDDASCDANNTSCFCYRAQTDAKKLSNHAFGRAIDINPQQNPYVSYKNGQPVWNHENSDDYIDRSQELDHMIKEGDVCYNIFASHGFTWGGNWKSIKDYQHFEKEE